MESTFEQDIASIVRFAHSLQHPDHEQQTHGAASESERQSVQSHDVLDMGLSVKNAQGEIETRMRNDNQVGEDISASVLMPAAAESVYGMYVVPGAMATDEH
jgi:hypothetical protein